MGNIFKNITAHFKVSTDLKTLNTYLLSIVLILDLGMLLKCLVRPITVS